MSGGNCEECGKPLDALRRPGVSLFHGACWVRRLQREIEEAPDDQVRQVRRDFLAAVLKLTS
jgi:hypothetical protein